MLPMTETNPASMKKIIFCDIDGCLNLGKNISLDLEVLTKIKKLIPRLSEKGIGFTMSTGRPQPYAEAFAQLLNSNLPLVCEGGAMVYAPENDEYRAMALPETLDSVKALRMAIQNSGLLNAELFFEIGKAYSLCVTGPYLTTRDHNGIRSEMENFKKRYSDYPVNWTHSTTSIDITPLGTSKASGLSAICAEFGVKLADTMAIGDSNGDISMLEVAGQAFCPQNASDEVKHACQYVSSESYAQGTLDILKRVLNQV